MQHTAPLVTLTARKRRASPMRRQETLMAALLILPSTLGILAFAVLPIAASLGISLTDWGGLSKPNFVGFQNYATALQDPRATSALSHTLIYVLLAVPTGVIISLTLAVWINNLKAGWLRTVFRTVYYLPMVTIGVAVALLWQVLLAPQGLVNLILGWLGVHGPNWLGSPAWVLPAVAVFSVWQGSGQGIILFLASLASVPRELYEAAQLDGARPFDTFRFITLPMISPTIFLVHGAERDRGLAGVRGRAGAVQRRARRQQHHRGALHLQNGLHLLQDGLRLGAGLAAGDHPDRL